MNGIYVHIPFCARKCGYCDFHSVTGAGRWGAYEEELRREMDCRRSSLRYTSVYFGGGTPSLPVAEALPGVLRALRERYDLAPDAEITAEANPDSLTPEKLAAWREAGIGRVSLGLQAVQPEALRVLGRLHDYEQAAAAVRTAKQEGIARVSLDLIYGLPGQTLAQWQECLEGALALETEHISCYALTLAPGTALYGARLPDADAQADMLECADELLEGAGLARYEISNWGEPCRHNLAYWRYGEWLGLGASAHGHLGACRYANALIGEYLTGKHEREREALPPREEALECAMMGLRLVEGIDPTAIGRRFGVPVSAFLNEAGTGRLAQLGLLEPGERIRLTKRGLALQNAVLGELLRI